SSTCRRPVLRIVRLCLREISVNTYQGNKGGLMLTVHRSIGCRRRMSFLRLPTVLLGMGVRFSMVGKRWIVTPLMLG
ncbi:MAG: hypothetical protein LBS46_01450, partial [Dysgonamonadaceae bacterium]|nr:hypothetical protein [Dysgonamonadaceae bacterium]